MKKKKLHFDNFQRKGRRRSSWEKQTPEKQKQKQESSMKQGPMKRLRSEVSSNAENTGETRKGKKTLGSAVQQSVRLDAG